jgi:hypothetical protein
MPDLNPNINPAFLEPPPSYDPVFTGYGAPVVTFEPYNVTFDSSILYSAYEPVEFQLTWAGDSETTISNQIMYAEVYHGASATLLGTQRKTSVSIEGATKYRFNFSDMLKTVLAPEFYNYITSDQINSSASLEDLGRDFYVKFYVKYLDELNVERQDTTLTSSTYPIVNTIIGNDEKYRIISGSYFDWVLDSTTSTFLTNAPANKQIQEGEDEQLMFYYTGALQLELNYQTYDLGGNANSAQTKSLVTIVNNYGTITISDNGASTLIDDFANISKIDVWIEESDGNQISEKRTYVMNHTCTEGFRLWWMNSYGAIDKYTFDAHTNTSYMVHNRNTFQKPLEVGLGALTVADQKTMLAQKESSVLLNSGSEVYSCTSTFQAGDMDFFKDLLKSQDVRYQPSTTSATSTNLFPVMVKSMEQVLTDTDGLIQVNIEFVTSKKDKNHIG